MWIHGTVNLTRSLEYRRNGGAWTTHAGTWGTSPVLCVHPAEFIYASMRTGATGSPSPWRARAAGLFGGLMAMSYLDRGAFTPAYLSLHPDYVYAKDFFGTSVKGILGGVVAFLEARAQGYEWSAHFEDAFPSVGGRNPDFVFFRNSELLLVEGKGTEELDPSRRNRLKGHWMGQIWPHLAATGATDGWLIAVCLSGGVGATLERLRLAPPIPVPPAGAPPLLTGRDKAHAIIRGFKKWLGLPSQLADRRAEGLRTIDDLLVGKPLFADALGLGLLQARPFVSIPTLRFLRRSVAADGVLPSRATEPRVTRLSATQVRVDGTDGTGVLLELDQLVGPTRSLFLSGD